MLCHDAPASALPFHWVAILDGLTVTTSISSLKHFAGAAYLSTRVRQVELSQRPASIKQHTRGHHAHGHLQDITLLMVYPKLCKKRSKKLKREAALAVRRAQADCKHARPAHATPAEQRARGFADSLQADYSNGGLAVTGRTQHKLGMAKHTQGLLRSMHNVLLQW